jgi:hypothetical protein
MAQHKYFVVMTSKVTDYDDGSFETGSNNFTITCNPEELDRKISGLKTDMDLAVMKTDAWKTGSFSISHAVTTLTDLGPLPYEVKRTFWSCPHCKSQAFILEWSCGCRTNKWVVENPMIPGKCERLQEYTAPACSR